MGPIADTITPLDSLPSAGLWRRMLSVVYEGIVLFGVVVFFGYAYSALLQFRGEPGGLRWGLQGWLFLVIGIYFVWFWSEGRRTLPMRTIGLRLVDAANQPLTRSRALLRYLIAWVLLLLPIWAASQTGHPVWLLLLLLPMVWTFVDGQRRTLYDRLAGTRLVIDTRPVV